MTLRKIHPTTMLFTVATLMSLTLVGLFALIVFAPIGIALLALDAYCIFGFFAKYRIPAAEQRENERHARLVRRSKGDRR